MFEAAMWGGLSAATLLVGAAIAYLLRPSVRLTAIVMALGSGLLIGSVSYELVSDARDSLAIQWVALSLLAGAAVFVLGSRLIDQMGGRNRKNPAGKGDDDNPLGIVLGSALDGIPESFVLGLSVLHGGVSLPLLLGIGLSNLPEGMAASAGLRARKWPMGKVMLMWSAVVATSALSAALGHQVLSSDDGTMAGVVQTFAAGALLAMISDTMIPESYAVERVWTGGLVVAGFAGSLLIAGVLG
jgi:ZIP family zinc transporter